MNKVIAFAGLSSIILTSAFGANMPTFENPSKTYFAVKGGYASSTLDVDYTNSVTGAPETFNTMGNGFGLSIALGVQKQTWQSVGIRAELEYRGGFGLDTDRVIDYDDGLNYYYGVDKYSNTYHSVMGNFFFDFTSLGTIKPYIGAGIGYVKLSRDIESAWDYFIGGYGMGTGYETGSSSGSSFGLGLYAGALIPLTERLDIDLGVGYNISSMAVDYVSRIKNESLSLLSIMAGIKCTF